MILKGQRYYHAVMMVVWALLVIPTLIWWKDSVLWVAFLSLYANFGAEFGAWHASTTQLEQAGHLNPSDHDRC